MEVVPTGPDGQTVYRAALPKETIRPGLFTVRAAGGSDVGPFESSVRIGSGISISSSFAPGTVLSFSQPITVNWAGGDPDTWVTVRVVSHHRVRDAYSSAQTHTSNGSVTVDPPLPMGPDVEIVVVVTPDPSQVPVISASRLSLGGQNVWKYIYRFGGLAIQ